MKRISYFICGLALMLFACSDEVVVDLSKAEEQNYGNVYIPQAGRSVEQNTLLVKITDKPRSFIFSAFYGGSKPAEQDIKVNFEVNLSLVDDYNEKNSKDCLPMPAGSYSFETFEGFIKAGTNNSGALTVNIFCDKFEEENTYLLPISIASVSGGEKISQTQRNVYFVIFVQRKDPGDVPRELVYSFGDDFPDEIVFNNNKDVLRLTRDRGMLVYQLDDNGVYKEPFVIRPSVEWGWNYPNVFVEMIFMPPDRIMGIYTGNTLECYHYTGNYNYSRAHSLGSGWLIFEKIMPFKDMAMLCVEKDGGQLRRYPVSYTCAFGSFAYVGAEDRNYLDFAHLFTYVWDDAGSMIGIDDEGNMWYIPVSDDGELGDETLIGEGWDFYNKVLPSGTDLLALDARGDLWRYQFNPNEFWSLKEKEEE